MFYKLTPSLNASLTLNTDFSATEVDDRQVNLTRFGLFFPEQRDFFLQDADIFEFGRIGQRSMDSPFARPLEENALPFFSRRIGLSATGEPVDLEGGGKLSGRAGRWTIGTLAIRQDEFENVEPADLFVGRVAANVLAESAVGLIVTDGDPLSNLDNSVAGVDFRYQNTRLPNGRTLESEAWYQQSSTEGPRGRRRRLGRPASGRRTRRGSRAASASRKSKRTSIPRWGSSTAATSATTRASSATPTARREAACARSTPAPTFSTSSTLDGGLQSEVAQLRVELENQTTDKLTLALPEREGGRSRALRDLRRASSSRPATTRSIKSEWA